MRRFLFYFLLFSLIGWTQGHKPTSTSSKGVEKIGPDLACLEWLMECESTRVRMSDGQSITRQKEMREYIPHALSTLPPTDRPIQSGDTTYEKQFPSAWIVDVNASDSAIANEGFTYFRDCRRIEKMKLNFCDYFGDEGLKFLAQGRPAQTLNDLEIVLNPCMTDGAVYWLLKLKSLRRAHFYFLPYVAHRQGFIRQLKIALPKCDVTFPEVDVIGLGYEQEKKKTKRTLNDLNISPISLANTPSIQQGLTKEEELLMRRDGVTIITSVGHSLNCKPRPTIGVAAVYFYRFYMLHPFQKFNREVTALCCLFLAGKVEDFPKKCKDVCQVATDLYPEIYTYNKYQNLVDDVMGAERVLLHSLKFDLQVGLPYDALLEYKTLFPDMCRKQITDAVQIAWPFINDSINTTLCITTEPQMIAIALLHDVSSWPQKSVDKKTQSIQQGRTNQHKLPMRKMSDWIWPLDALKITSVVLAAMTRSPVPLVGMLPVTQAQTMQPTVNIGELIKISAFVSNFCVGVIFCILTYCFVDVIVLIFESHNYFLRREVKDALNSTVKGFLGFFFLCYVIFFGVNFHSAPIMSKSIFSLVYPVIFLILQFIRILLIAVSRLI